MNLLRTQLGAPTTDLSGSARVAREKCELNARAGDTRHVGANSLTLVGDYEKEARHEAVRAKARRAPAARGQRTNCPQVNGLHGGVLGSEFSVSGDGARKALMSNDRSPVDGARHVSVTIGCDFQIAEGSCSGFIRSNVDPKRRSRGAISTRTGARASDVRGGTTSAPFGVSRVVRLTGGCNSGPNGFDVAGRSGSNVSAALDCRERRATYNCERQRGSRSGCGLSDAGARGVRVARRRHHTSWATRDRHLAAEKLTVVEAPTPRRHGQPVALNPATHVSEILVWNVADRGSIPRGSTGLCAMARSASPTIRSERAGGPTPPRWWKSSVSTSVTGGESAATLQGRGTVPRRAHNAKAAGSTPAPATIEAVPLVGGSTHGGSAGMNSCGVVIQRRRCRGSTSNALGQLPQKVGGLRVRLLQTDLTVTKVAQATEGTGAPGLPERTARIHPLERRATINPLGE
jgi:hypothetical protein